MTAEQWRELGETLREQATASNGDKWTGEINNEYVLYFVYRNKAGELYESREVPYVRLDILRGGQL